MLALLLAALVAASVTFTAEQDHQNMMDQLHINSLRPGPSGNEAAPNHANYDEALANPYPKLPAVLTLNDGQPVTTSKQWFSQRRAEIVEAFEREVIGRVPAKTPSVTWTVTSSTSGMIGTHPVLIRQMTGHVDNSLAPDIKVDIQVALVTPSEAKGPVPVMIMFGWGYPPPPLPPGFPKMPPSTDPPATAQLIAAGWAFASLVPGSVQADNGAGLTRGIVGLCNLGQPRHPDDWGALRAWAWGASRALDYLATDPAIDARKAGIEGVSRYGKAALITMAFDTRFAVALIGSSGEGGAKLHRRNFGEAVESLTGSGEYHWMAGNFLKYGGPLTPNDLPVDAHELIALCAPRPTFISYGSPEHGDAKWLDQRGSYMAMEAAAPVYKLLGANLDQLMANPTMPAIGVSLTDGPLAWRQHDGGHTDGPNWKVFLPWADKEIR